MRDDLLKEHLMGYARTADDEAAQPDAAAIHRRARRHYQRVAALTVAGVLLAVGLGLGLSRDHTTPTVNQPLPTVNQIPPVPPPPAPGPTPSTATAPVTGKLPAAFVGDLGGRVAVISTTTGRTVRTLYGSKPFGTEYHSVGLSPDRATVYFSVGGGNNPCAKPGIFRVPTAGGRPVRVVTGETAGASRSPPTAPGWPMWPPRARRPASRRWWSATPPAPRWAAGRPRPPAAASA